MTLVEHRENWELVRLDEVLTKREENDRENARNRFDTFVKVEHMQAERLHLLRVGSQKEEELPPTFYKIFRKGQILFPTRNPHLRRTALANCDGICGEKTLTLEVNNEEADPRLISFLFHSASFYDHTAGAIIGSTNPHCRWRDVGDYKFRLPPKDQQAKLAELLWAADETLEKELELLANLRSLELSYKKQHLKKYRRDSSISLPRGYEVKTLGELADVSGGSTPSRSNSANWGDGIPWLTPTDLTAHSGIYITETAETITPTGLQSISSKLYPENSILFCSRASIGELAINSVPMATNQGFSNFVCNKGVNVDFLYFLLQHITPELRRLAGGSTFLEISKTAIRGFKVVLPPPETVNLIASELLSIRRIQQLQEERVATSKQVLSSLINQIF